MKNHKRNLSACSRRQANLQKFVDKFLEADCRTGTENGYQSYFLVPRGDLLFNGFEGPVKPTDSRDGNEDNCGEQNAEKARSYAVFEALMPPEDYIEILRFRHYTHFWNFESKGKNSRRKSIVNSIEVSVILHLVTVDSF